MLKFVIERDIPGVGSSSAADLQGVAQASGSVRRDLGPEIRSVHSYITDDTIYCIYNAPSEELIREHATRGGFPVKRISKINSIIHPTTAEV